MALLVQVGLELDKHKLHAILPIRDLHKRRRCSCSCSCSSIFNCTFPEAPLLPPLPSTCYANRNPRPKPRIGIETAAEGRGGGGGECKERD